MAKLTAEEIKERKKLRAIAYYQKNKEKLVSKQREYSRNNKEKCANKMKKWRESNPEKSKAGYKRQNANRDVVKVRESNKTWAKNNVDKIRAIRAKRRADRTNAIPTWLTEEHFSKIKEIYKEAKNLQEIDGIKREVDHIIPIKGKEVCGLHVPWNLQVLTAEENNKKSNKLLTGDSGNG